MPIEYDGWLSILYCLVLHSNHYYEFIKHLNMNFIHENKMLLLTMPMAMSENRFSFSIHDARSLTNIKIVSVYGDYQYIVEI